MDRVEVVVRPLFRASESSLPGYDAVLEMWQERFGYAQREGEPFVVEFRPRTSSQEDDDEAWQLANELYVFAVQSEHFVAEMEIANSYRVVLKPVNSIREKIKGQLRSVMNFANG